MKITKLEKKKRLYLLELDQAESLYITEDTIVRFMLSRDKEISQEELKEIQTFAQLSHAKNLALYHLSFKARTAREVRDYLIKHEIDESTIETVINTLKEDKWIDDLAYTRAIFQSNQLSGDKGPYLLKQKLIQKGVSSHYINQITSEFDFSEVAQRTAQKLAKQYAKKLPPRALKDKITQTLINKGFSYEVAKQAYHQLDIEPNEEQTLDLIMKELEKQHQKYSRKYEGYELKQRLTQALARKGYDYADISTALREFL